MGKKYSDRNRNHNVTVPLDTRLVVDYLARGVGGTLECEFRTAQANGFTPFERTCKPDAYSCADSFRRDYLLAMMLSKFDDGKSSDAKRIKALGRFAEAEDRCRQANSRLRSSADIRFKPFMSARDVLYVAQRKISRLLGDFDWNEAERGFGFGPGASTRLARRHSMPLYKYTGQPEVTTNCADLGRTVLQYNNLWREVVLNGQVEQDYVKVVRANRVVTVPKNAKTDRVIAIEPDLNLYIQKGLGAIIRHRLRRVGINLNDQRINQHLAWQGSVTGKLATLDLSMASDTVSSAIVEVLLPPDWLLALEQCRSPEGVLPCGRIIRYHKFSSMGNGYTFELESLIFWALCSAVIDLLGETDIGFSVYGDDLIVPTGTVGILTGLLSFCGFELNAEKSFSDGPFRESCGKHYFAGTDVTPFFVRNQPKELKDVFLLHNNVVRWCARGGQFLDSGVDGRLHALCNYLRGQAPSNWRVPRIPDGFGDGAFIGSVDETRPRLSPAGKRGYERVFESNVIQETLLDRSRNDYGPKQGGPAILAALSFLRTRGTTRSTLSQIPVSMVGDVHLSHDRVAGQPARGLGNQFIPEQIEQVLPSGARRERNELRDRICKIRIPITQWADLGPWI